MLSNLEACSAPPTPPHSASQRFPPPRAPFPARGRCPRRPERCARACPYSGMMCPLPLSVSCSLASDSATLRTVSHKALLSIAFSRKEYWSGLPFPSPGDLPDRRMELRSLAYLESSLKTGGDSRSVLQLSGRGDSDFSLVSHPTPTLHPPPRPLVSVEKPRQERDWQEVLRPPAVLWKKGCMRYNSPSHLLTPGNQGWLESVSPC